jgi:general L-amino acid transport system permease protein
LSPELRPPGSEEQYELTGAVAEDAPAVEIAPEAEPQSLGEWIRRNLFSSTFNSVLTVISAAVVVWVAVQIFRFVFVTGEWSVLKANLRVYMVGRFPVEELWRVWIDVYLVMLLVGLSRGVIPRRPWTLRRSVARVAIAAVLGGVVLYLVESRLVLVLLGLAVALELAGVAVGRLVGRRLRTPLFVAWILAFPVIVLVLRAFDGVKPELWGGFMLNVIVAVVAIFVSFPIGVLLALGRRSTLPAVRAFCVGFIELIRGVPLVTLLIFGIFVLPLLLPPSMEPPNIVLAMIMFIIFSAAYTAEITRGGLQGVADGQFEAARALGLRYPRMMALVVLPQALRNTIPAMISHNISLFKDTSLLAALGFFSDLLSVASRATRDLEFVGQEQEALLPAALIFWVGAYSMAKWSQRVEQRVGVGER